MTIINKTEYTFDTLYAFNKSFLKNKRALWITYGIVSVTVFLSFALHLFTTFTFGDGTVNPIMIYGFAVMLVIDLYYVLLCTVFLKLIVKKSPQLNTTVETVFTEESFTENSASTNIKSSSVVSYDQILKVTQNEGYLYIYIAKNAACILDKNGFVDEGDLEYLVALLRAKLPESKIKL